MEYKVIAGRLVEDILRDMYYTTCRTGNKEAHHVNVNGVRVIMFQEK